jgi:glycosyltransferase involved in cell wall biosynthesis
MNEPLISIIIPTFNRAHTVSETIDSVLGQTYQHIEVIVVDDGSTDNTQEVLRHYGARIRNICQDNAGQVAARNRGIREACGEIITFLDSDDLWLPHCLGTHLKLLQKAPAEVPCSLVNGWLHFADGRRMTSFQNSHLAPSLKEGLCLNLPDLLATRFIMFCQFIAIRRKAVEKTGAFDDELKFMEDYALPLRLSLLGPWAFTSEPLVTWRQGVPGSISVSQRAIEQEVELRENLLIIRQRYLQMIDGNEQFAKSKHLQSREQHLDRLELRAIALRRQGRKAAGDLLFRLVRYRKGLFRRGPWFPGMKVAEFVPEA